MIQDNEWRLSFRELNYITILRKKWSYIGKLRTSLKCSKNKTTKGKENCQWNENFSAMFVVNKQRKHSRSFGLTGCRPWPLIDKVFYRYRKTDGDDYEPDPLPGLQRSKSIHERSLSEGRSPFTVLSLFKRQLVTPEQYSSQHQQILLL